MKRCLALLLCTFLTACAEQPYVLSQSPDAVSICSGNTGIPSLIAAAQKQCSVYDKTAELIPATTKTKCPRDNIAVVGYVQQFQCKRR